MLPTLARMRGWSRLPLAVYKSCEREHRYQKKGVLAKILPKTVRLSK